MKWRSLLAVWMGVVGSGVAWAQAEPVDKNFAGPYAGGQLLFGWSNKVGESTPSPAWLLSGDIGYGMKRDTWNRVEMGLELGTGAASFKDKDNGGVDVDLDLRMVAMLKGGYGYSLGQQTFGFFRVGLGMAQADYEGKIKGVTFGEDSATALVTMVGWDAVYFATEKLDLTLGASFRFFNFNFGDVPGDAGSFQLNMPSLSAGFRFRL